MTAEAFLAAIVESTDDAVIGKTSDGIILSWNPAAREMYGYSPEEVIGKCISMLVPSDRSYEVSEILEKIKRGKRVDHYETIRLTKDGTDIHVSLTVSPIKDASAKIIGASTIARNVTERQQIQQALRESEETFRSVFENSRDGILFTAPDGRIFKANPAACNMLERSEQELYELGRDSVVDCSDSRLAPALKEREQTGQFRGELNFKRKDGTTFPAEISSSVYRDAKGNSRTSIVFRDVTKRQRLEQEKAKLVVDLRGALAQVKKLSGLLPICASCKKIRDDKGYWTQMEAYIKEHSEAEFSHGICPECARKLYPELYEYEPNL